MKLTVPQTNEEVRPLQAEEPVSAAPPQPGIFGERATWLQPFDEKTFRMGSLFLLLSLAVSVWVDWISEQPDRSLLEAAFLGQYLLTAIYSIRLLVSGHVNTKELLPEGRHARWIGLLLWLLSAFALNRIMVLFQASTLWLQIMLIMAGTAMVAHVWKEQMPVRMQQVLYVLLAACWWLFLYAAFYLIELYLISLPGVLLFGLTFHTFIPILMTWVIGKRLWVDFYDQEHLRPAILAGGLVPVVIFFTFMAMWGKQVERLETAKATSVMRQTDDLPEWVLLAQQLDHNWLVSRMLRVHFFYDDGGDAGRNRMGNLAAVDDRKEHDPLLVIANRTTPLTAIPEEDRIRLLRTVEGDRHGTGEKFWLGQNLITRQVITQARIWPQFRLAYTEKTVLIRNTAQQTTREALYTFHLPAGSVVSSLSLWINGREEKARLASLAKADSAYRQIVNIESRPVGPRDPAVAYWQEGNLITVRVFPCPAAEDRQFKIGITSPLQLTEQNRLVYENPFFEGPDTRHAKERIQLQCMQPLRQAAVPDWLETGTGEELTYAGDYQPDWSVSFDAPPLSTAPFVLDGKAYTPGPYVPQNVMMTLSDVYLDINAAWTRKEFDRVFRWATQANRTIWVFDDGLKQVTDASAGAYFDKLSKQTFTLFPCYRILHPETALLITRGTQIGPVLAELKNSPFAAGIQAMARQRRPVPVICLAGSPVPPYLKSLSELQVITLEQSPMDSLEDRIRFHPVRPKLAVKADEVALPMAGMTLRRSAATVQQAALAPDHLARLFIYNDIMRRVGPRFFDQSFKADQALVAEAAEAHILSPVSSLIVLETIRDYDRFGIKRDHKGLDNATMKTEGAVPEPHEWALLIACLLCLFIAGRRRFA